MDDKTGRDGLQQCVAGMIALELRIEETLGRSQPAVGKYLEAPDVVGRLRAHLTGQREALALRLQGLERDDGRDIGAPLSTALEASPTPLPSEDAGATVGWLHTVAAAFDRAAFGYAVLHAVAHRFYDVATADLADRHRRNYLQAERLLHRAIGDVVIQELQDAGQECRCQCPSCNPGICLCWHEHAESEARGPEAVADGIVVRRPRPQSNAEHAGLREGDTVLAVDGREVRSYQDMLDRMRDRQPGEETPLRIRRRAGAVEDLVMMR